MDKLALYGGSPVRTEPMPTSRLGSSLIGAEELAELTEVVMEKSPFRHYGIGQPNKAKAFEAETRELLNVKYTLAVSSGTAALACAMVALGVGPGDEVILPAFGWHSDYSCIVMSGALPVFAEIDDTLNLDPDDFARKITARTKAVIVIHYQGGVARMDKILGIAQKKRIKVIEDCAQAFGGQYDGKFLGTLGDIGITSFQFNKMITCGEGGLFYTNDEHFFVKAVRHHDLGLVRPYFLEQLTDKSLGDASVSFPGNQFRISELQAAFILAQLRKLPLILDKCRAYYALLESQLSGLSFKSRPVFPGHSGITFFMKFDSSAEANTFTQALVAEGIPCGPSSSCTNMMELPMIINKAMSHRDMPPFGVGYSGEFIRYDNNITSANTTRIVSAYTSIGIGPQYTEEDVLDIVTAVKKVDAELYSKQSK